MAEGGEVTEAVVVVAGAGIFVEVVKREVAVGVIAKVEGVVNLVAAVGVNLVVVVAVKLVVWGGGPMIGLAVGEGIAMVEVAVADFSLCSRGQGRLCCSPQWLYIVLLCYCQMRQSSCRRCRSQAGRMQGTGR